MRTPGRCSNIEGCWISASQRDVWLTVGEDFTCPNCGGALLPPPGRSVSMHGLKRAAMTGIAATMAVAAVAVATVRISPSHFALPNSVLAMVEGKRPVGSLRAKPAQNLAVAPTAANRLAQAAAPEATRPAPAATVPTALAPTPAAPEAGTPPTARLAQGGPDTPMDSAPPAGISFYSANDTPPSAASHKQARGTASVASASQAPSQDAAAVAVAPVTFISQASFSVSMVGQRPISLPISFGEPPAPETDAAPADRRWRYHSLSRTRRSYFLPAPGGGPAAICPTPAVEP